MRARRGARNRAARLVPEVLPLRLDIAEARAWQGEQLLQLTPKAFAVLQFFLAHVGRLITKDELLRKVWAESVVTDGALAACLRELREALGDDIRQPRYIETVHRRGYRFIGPVVSIQYPVSRRPEGAGDWGLGTSSSSPQASSPQSLAPHFVGRETELTSLQRLFEKALRGERQVLFVTGEAGIGKTTLVDAFLLGMRDWGREASVGRGQCIEQYGAGEAYLPLLEALGRLGRAAANRSFVDVFRQYAPTWLVQLPALLTDVELANVRCRVQGATKERMVRELAEALEVITVERPLVLVLEDLHWSDPSTLDVLAMVARRTEPARLFIIGSYRPLAVSAREYPLKTLKAELQLHKHCQELPLELLNEAQAREYLVQRGLELSRAQERAETLLPGKARDSDVLNTLARLIHQRTEGNPLFMSAMVDDLLARGLILWTDAGWELQEEATVMESTIPDSIRHLMTLQSDRLSSDVQRTLEAASVAGMEFSTAAVAAALTTETVEVEQQCQQLADRAHFCRRLGVEEWTDGTLAARYGFLHAVYQQMWHERVSPTQLQRYHRRIGERKELAYGERAREIAVELAVHFEQGRVYEKAIRYRQKAGENAMRRSAYQEATNHFSKGLELLKTYSESPARLRQELVLRLALGESMVPALGYTARDVEETYTRARELCQQFGETSRLFSVLESLVIFHFNRGELQTAHDLAKQMFGLAQSDREHLPLSVAHGAMGWTSYLFGELSSARSHLESAVALHDSLKQSRSVAFNTADLKVECLSFAAWTSWALGYPDWGLKRVDEALTAARSLSHPFSLAFALGCAAFFHLFCRQEQIAREYAETTIALSTEQGFPHWLAFGTMVRGWALTEQGLASKGVAQMRESRALFLRPVLLAEGLEKVGQIEEGLAVLTKALAFIETNGMRIWGAELYRLRGELTLQLKVKSQKSKEEEAGACFLRAIKIARQQQAKSFELRAVMSLSQVWLRQGKREEARQMLTEIYNWFTEGFDTKDLQEAKGLLQELSH